MSGIRKQSIISSILVYIGVLFGAVNTYFFVKDGAFTEEQYGLTRMFADVGQNFFVIASLGIISVVYKFYPYYKDNLPDKQNDLFGRSLIYCFIGFIMVIVGAYIFEPLIIRKFGERSKLFVDYYFWVIPFSFGLLMFSLLEGYSWAIQKAVLPNFLKETGLRLITTIFILLYLFGIVNFHVFMMLFSALYMIIALILLLYLVKSGQLHFHFKTSRVTRKFRKKMMFMQWMIFGGIIVSTIGSTIDGLIIASLIGLADTGVYMLALFTANLIQIPQRSIQSIATGILVRNWKDKNYAEIKRIYQRSSINMLLIALFIFGNIWLNIDDALTVFNVREKYAAGVPLVLLFGIIRTIDAGTGLNAQVIGASIYWRFEFFSGVVMLTLRIPLVYFFIKEFGIIGATYGDLISLSVYNFIRFQFLRRRFNMQPFSIKTVYAILLGLAAYFITFALFKGGHSFIYLVLRGLLFSGIMVAGIYLLKLTPDAMQLIDTLKKRVKK